MGGTAAISSLRILDTENCFIDISSLQVNSFFDCSTRAGWEYRVFRSLESNNITSPFVIENKESQALKKSKSGNEVDHKCFRPLKTRKLRRHENLQLQDLSGLQGSLCFYLRMMRDVAPSRFSSPNHLGELFQGDGPNARQPMVERRAYWTTLSTNQKREATSAQSPPPT